ncbi:cytochrome P450 [Dactylonectria macrodidyma]|uniref:Cytochrome P450 n=1 Tax=Dactylonectria macrodidyma TaxID=307937 RepID=A0A9P9EQB2_9HYPO|nr:cytochrome P450 [Dactylonectria macrodidyma]
MSCNKLHLHVTESRYSCFRKPSIVIPYNLITFKPRAIHLTRKYLPDEASAQDLKIPRYLNQVVKETLPLYTPVSAGLPRVVPAGGFNVAGYYVPAGTVTTQAYSLHRNPEIFSNQNSFDPSRWDPPTKDMSDSFWLSVEALVCAWAYTWHNWNCALQWFCSSALSLTRNSPSRKG